MFLEGAAFKPYPPSTSSYFLVHGSAVTGLLLEDDVIRVFSSALKLEMLFQDVLNDSVVIFRGLFDRLDWILVLVACTVIVLFSGEGLALVKFLGYGISVTGTMSL